MVARDFHFHNGKKGAALAVRVVKSSGTDKFQEILKDGTVLIKVINNSGDLNKKLVKFLSKKLNIPQKNIDIIAGDEGEDKLLSILDVDPTELQKLIISKIP
jgi:uncharacterized protein YggU (UPF0235/DUF167 family)